MASFAEGGLQVAKQLIQDPKNAFVRQSLVLSQQSAEKALKGYLFFQSVIPAKTHDLVKHCRQFDNEFIKLIDHAIDLSPHISVSPYPDSRLILPDLTTAKILVERSEIIYWFVKNRIS